MARATAPLRLSARQPPARDAQLAYLARFAAPAHSSDRVSASRSTDVSNVTLPSMFRRTGRPLPGPASRGPPAAGSPPRVMRR
jgi:hypothetical protein